MRKQQGMTLIGMLLTMAVVVMAAIVVMRIVPVVIQHYTIVTAIKSLAETPAATLTGDPVADISTLRISLTKRLDINGLEDLKPEELTIVPDGEHQYKAHLKYTVIRPLVYNVSLLFHFDRNIEVVVGSEN
jgi:hypothetical protein